uniref:MORN repeat-containing protein 5 n=1 Tax=Haptolina ericina TaxID=156174 RepID=A0A7S3ACP1_9EUKA
MRDGEGTWEAPDGRHQRGMWRQDRLHGHGTLREADGMAYEGSFDAGRRGGSSVVEQFRLQALYARWEAALLSSEVAAEAQARAAEGGADEQAGTAAEASGSGDKISVTTLRRAMGEPPPAATLSAALAELRGAWLKLYDSATVHGYGTLRLPSGEVYEGYFRDNLCTGPGLWLHLVCKVPGDVVEALGASPLVMARELSGETVRCALGVFKGGLLSGLGMAIIEQSGQPVGSPAGQAMVHVGQFFDGLATGRGTRWFPNGDTYTGQWMAGRFHGQGELTSTVATAEVRYRGTWQHGKRHGEGFSERPDGSSYRGQWSNGVPQGRGIFHKAGALGPIHEYTGEVVAGARAGRGILRLLDSGDSYEGEWHLAEGLVEGLCRYADGGEYEGEFDDELRPHGLGCRTWADGRRYDGNFVHGAREGQGAERSAVGDEEYDGEWVADERNGKGTLRLPDGGVHEGFFRAGRRHGLGLLRYSDGSSYEGEWLDDLQDGVGNFYFADKSTTGADMYGGHWQQGQWHGHGVYSYSSGASFDGEHVHGMRHGPGKLTLRDGVALEASWVQGEPVGEGRIRYGDGSLCVVQLEAQPPTEMAPQLTVGASGQTCEFHWPNGDVYCGTYAASAEGGPLQFEPSGTGTLTTAQGAKLFGEFSGGKLRGVGHGTYPGGETYEGEFADSMRSGEGTSKYADGAVYKGRWDADMRQGRGLLILPAGDMLSANFHLGEPAGSGTLIYAEGGSYDGELQGLRRHGWGVLQDGSGYHYEGDWLDDERTGYGRETRENGDVYEGQFLASRRHGHGRYLSARGEEYNGSWVQDQRSGQGVSTTLLRDEAEHNRQRASAKLLAHREHHFLRLSGIGEGAGRL